MGKETFQIVLFLNQKSHTNTHSPKRILQKWRKNTVIYFSCNLSNHFVLWFITYYRHQLLPQISQLLSGVDGIPDIWRQTGRPCIPRLVCSMKQVSLSFISFLICMSDLIYRIEPSNKYLGCKWLEHFSYNSVNALPIFF